MLKFKRKFRRLNVNLLKRIYQPNYSYPHSRDISRDFPQETEVVAALLRGFNYLYKISVYQIKFDGSQASCPIGTTIQYMIGQEVATDTCRIKNGPMYMQDYRTLM